MPKEEDKTTPLNPDSRSVLGDLLATIDLQKTVGTSNVKPKTKGSWTIRKKN